MSHHIGTHPDAATFWMHRGLALMAEQSHAAAREALTCFERAIALRSAVGGPLDGAARYDLAGSWINRADALLRLGRREHHDEAVRSLDVAIELLGDSCIGMNALWRRRLAIAWHNRGLALERVGARHDLCEALECFDRSRARIVAGAGSIPTPGSQGSLICHVPTPDLELPDRRILASAWIGRGRVFLQRDTDGDPAEARQAAIAALGAIAAVERSDRESAEAGLQARHVQCHALARLVEAAARNQHPTQPWLDEATEVVEDGLRLGGEWERRGVRSLRPWLYDLFRFGARVYQAHQPHFLVEFLLDSFDPERRPEALPLSAEIHEAALSALWGRLRTLQKDGFRSLRSAEFGEFLRQLEELQLAEERLNTWRSRFAAGSEGG